MTTPTGVPERSADSPNAGASAMSPVREKAPVIGSVLASVCDRACSTARRVIPARRNCRRTRLASAAVNAAMAQDSVSTRETMAPAMPMGMSPMRAPLMPDGQVMEMGAIVIRAMVA